MDVAAGDGQEQGWKQLPLKKREEERAENCRLGSVLLLSLLTTCKNIWPLSSTQTAGNQLVLGAFL